MEKFPDHVDSLPSTAPASPTVSNGPARTTSPSKTASASYANGAYPIVGNDRWRAASGARLETSQPPPPRAGLSWSSAPPPAGRKRQKSINEAFRTMRHGSMSQNAHEIADALRAPVSPKLILLCILWYTSSALTNTSSKAILITFNKPATLTLVQFAFVASYCVFSARLADIFPHIKTVVPALKHPIRRPSRHIIVTTLPLAAFQIGGHLLSSTATAKIPVSLVHTIKGLSPLFTVLAYRFVYDIRYPTNTYLSLVPLTFGVMLACSGKHGFGGELLGIIYALLATIIFVTQNIFSKRLFNEAAKYEAEGVVGAQSGKPDKLNLLCYSSGLAFIVTLPIWLWSEGIGIFKDFVHDGSVDLTLRPDSLDHGRLTLEFVFNGSFHFGQNILAFILLSLVSPVTYSVASLIKRVFVVVLAILWFQNPTTSTQAFGIALTFLGLYLYDRTSDSNKADRRARTMTEKGRNTSILPLSSRTGSRSAVGVRFSDAPLPNGHGHGHGHALGQVAEGYNPEDKKSEDMGRSGITPAAWLPSGTKQEETWLVGDRKVGVEV